MGTPTLPRNDILHRRGVCLHALLTVPLFVTVLVTVPFLECTHRGVQLSIGKVVIIRGCAH